MTGATEMSSNPCDLSARELQRALRSKVLSPIELMEATIQRIETINPRVNAVVSTSFDTAMVAAREATDRIAAGLDLAPLHGLPVLIKDLSDTAGLRTTYGSRCYTDHVPDTDDLIVQRLRQAGAIVIGKTNTPEFGAGGTTANAVFGATVNPFNPAVTSGGSSGGSAAALACGMAPLATGSDLGGSLRIPASFCSVVGMRPSPGVVPSISRSPGFCPLWTDGPMATTVADVALMMAAISGFDRRDPLSLPLSLPNSRVTCANQPTNADLTNGHVTHGLRNADLSQLRVGFSTDLGIAPIDRDIARIFHDRRHIIAGPFAAAEKLALDLSAATDVFRILRAQSFSASYAALVADRGDEVGSNVRTNVLEALNYDLADAARAHTAHTALYRNFARLFVDVDVLVCPATAITPFRATTPHPHYINDQPLDSYFSWYAITWALSLTGCPVVTIPCGSDHKGMPFGIQIVGPRYADAQLLQVAQALEEMLAQQGLGRMVPAL